MNQKQRNRFAWTGCIIAVLVLLSGAGWIFRDEVKNLFTQKEIQEKPLTSVPRTTSYLGRIRAAEGFLAQGQYSRAAVELVEAISERPEIIRPYILLGEIHIRTRDFTKIEGLIVELDRRFPNEPETDVLRARELIAREDFAAARTILQKADSATLDPVMLLYQAILASLQNDHKRAKVLLSALGERSVQEPLMIGEDGVTEVEMENAITPEIAEKVKALQLVYDQFAQFADGEDPHLFALIAKALAENNEPTLARSFANVAIREDIAYVDAWMLRGYANFLLNDLSAALEDLRHAYKLDPVRPEVEYFLALTLEKLGQKMEAAMFYERLLTRDFPYHSEVRWKLIDLLTEQKEMDRVVELYQEQAEVESAPNKYVSVVHTLINVLHKPKEALALTETLLSKQPQNVLALNLRAWSLIEDGQLSEAEILLKKTEKLNPENPRTQLNFGVLREREGNPVAAREFYKKCYELGQGKPFSSVVELAVARYNALLGRDDKATKTLPAASP